MNNDPQQPNPYQTPEAGAPVQYSGGTYKPTLKQILFSFEGRIRRAQFWLAVLIQFVIILVVFVPFFAFVGGMEEGGPSNIPALIVFLLVFLVAAVFSTWISIASTVKRFHDRNKSGWWYLISLVPYIGGIWILIECGCLGPVEPNQYGPAAE